MPVIFVNERNEQEFLSAPILKRDLSLLENRSIDNIQDVNLSALEGPLGTIFDKLDIKVKKVTVSDIRNFLLKYDDSETLGFLFSLSKRHFLAIVFLFYEGYIGIEKIKNLLSIDYYSRNEKLIQYLDIEEPPVSLFTSFEKKLNEFFIPRSMETFNPEAIKNISYLRESHGLVPEQFYALASLLKKSNLSNVDSFSEVKWDVQNLVQLSLATKIKSYDSLENIAFEFSKFILPTLYANFYVIIFNPILALVIGATAIANWFIHKDFTSFLDLLFKRSSFRGAPRNISSEKIFDVAINKYFGEMVRKVYLRRMDNVAMESRSYQNNTNLITRAMKEGASESISDDNQKPIFISMFNYIQWMFSNTLNISTIENFDFNNFNFNNSGFNSQLSSAAYDFSYLNDLPVLKNYMESVFPNFSTVNRESRTYMSLYFLNKVFPPKFQSNQRTRLDLDSLYKTRSSEIDPKIRDIFNLDLVIRDDKTVYSLGNGGRRSFVAETFKVVMKSLGIENIDISTFSSFDSAKAYIDGLKVQIETKMKLQNTNIDSIDYNPLLIDQTGSSNRIFMIFLIDLVKEYFTFLVNGIPGKFVPVLSDQAMGAFRILNFVKHIFINLNKFIGVLKDDYNYKNFMMMILSVKYDLNGFEIRNLYNNGLSFSEMESLFKRG